MFLKPQAGLIVRDPVTKQALPEDGKRVQPSSFWLRRIAEGSVVEVTQPEVTPPQPIVDVEPTAEESAPEGDQENA